MPVVSFNYLGQFEQQSEFWHVVDESSGQAMHSENQETHCITCFGGIHQGRLRMMFRTQLSQEVTDRLVLVYKKQLLMIIDHQHSLARSFLTLSDIHHCVSAHCLDKLQHDRESDGVYLANSLHQGFIYHFMSQGQKDEAYRMQIVWSYDRQINIELLQRAWRFAQQRYPSLRLRFLVDEELVQVIDKTGHLHWQFIDLSQDKDNQEHKIQQLIQDDRQKAYDLTQGNLFRIQLIKQEATQYTCIFNAHHAIIDGWSGPILLGFVHEMYMKLLHQKCIDFTVDTAYAQSQHFLQVQELENQSFWQQYVSQIEHKADLSNLLQEGKKQLKLSDYKYIIHQSEQTICIAEERFKQIKMMSQEHGITLNAIILYAWHKVMRIYGNGKQTVVGTIVSGRNIPVDHVEHSVGLYINTLPMIVDHTQHDGLSVLAAIRRVQEISNEINQRNAMSLAKLQSQGERLFDCLFMYGNYPNLAVENPEDQLPFKIQSTFEKRDYPLSLAADEEDDLLKIKLTYAGELFDTSLMTQLLVTLNYLLDQMVRNPLQEVRELNYVESSLPEPMSSPGLSCTFIDYFEEQASLYPDRIALTHEQTQISYAELNQRANQLAHYIRQQVHLEKDSLIVLCLEKNEYLMIALLAVLKAGGAYLPIDPAMPAQRMQHLLDDSQAKLVLTCNAVSHTFPHAIILDDPDDVLAIAQQATRNLNWPLKSDDLAYVLYTSGTTGQPKGVMIEHRAFLQTLLSMQAEYFSEQKPLNTYSMTHFVFDIFGLEYGLPLLTGGRVELGTPLFNMLDCRSFDFIQMTPSVCELKLDSLQHCDATTFLIGGEALSPELLAKALAKAHRVINVYGPTETTIWSTAKLYAKHDVPTVSIGKPLHHESVYVLDDSLMPMPIGAVGELYIGGACLARGYLNRPDLTAKQFITHPLYNRLYKTGDLAKWLPHSELAFIGRNDFQVKIRGHRIELAEIEAILRMHPQLKQTVVIELEQNLIAYFTASGLVVEAQLRDFLKEQLPDYMLPQAYMQLEQFPLTVNGKLDRKALPKPNLTRRAHYALPTTEQEKLLAALWEEVLGVSKVGVTDNFFDLGGHSISLIKLFSKLPEAIKARITVLDLFKFPSISALLGYLTADKYSEESGQKRIQPALKQDDIAIIGMAGRFPGADDLETFWFNLQTGKEGLTYYSREELLEQGLDPSLVDHPNYVKAQCKLSDIKCFDAEFFGYTASEAEIMDPQHRLLMQCAWHALEDANYNPHHYAGDIGIFAGCGQNNYFSDHVLPNQTQDDLSRQFQLMIHQQANFLCTKIAYKLNLTGPAITIQTACSTSLVAVHQACLALNAGDCDMALAGGVSIGQLEKQGYLYQPGLIFSPDAKCRAFDAQAQGTFEGQGVGLVVLKPLSKALVDEDFIYAVIKASAINNDGHQKIGFTAPSPQKQAEVIRLAQQRAACPPDTISYIEAHGTGTALGDPIEMEGLAQVFKDSGMALDSCALGSVKTNIGHLDVAAGIAGLIKTILCLYHKQLVPTLHYQSGNSKINFAASPFYVNTVLKPWTQGDFPRRAGISSFGIGGTNAHLILEEAPVEAKQERGSPKLYAFAKTEYWLPARKTAVVAKPPTQANGVIVRDRQYMISVLRSLWTTLLGIESFKNNEDFFDLGGDSLVAVQLSAQLQRQLGVHLELMSLNRITIDGLLALIEKEQEKTDKAHSPVVLIKAGKAHQNKIPLVLIHPIGGDVYFYRDLAKALPENQAVYALRSPLLDGGASFASIESMAASYLHHLQQFGLQPPYILGGSSFGGAVALEMARQLTQSGQSIPLVVLIDTPAYTNLPKLMNPEEILIYLMQHGLGNLQISIAELQAQKTLEQKIELIANRAKDSELKELLSTEFLPRFLHTWQVHGQLLHQHQPEPYPGRVLFFAHTEIIDDFPSDQETHWQKLVDGSFKSILVPGTHITMNAAPHVQVIADALVFELKQRYYSRELLVEVEA
ncbi:non-ribosomal peptide synthetase [Legionella sainthelensi]|uniref:non-ribosomal peptide synthetase n=1 Tax=Legionella sainthelensi TaxID=28087 RepID=UPI001C6FCE6F|nr:non-ribosomal peptide synthetase [Legionella sainthelensi]